MKRFTVFFCIIPLFLLAVLVLIATQRSVYGEEGDSATKLFQKYRIPELLQHQPIYYSLRRSEWLADIARTGDWVTATQHPAMPKDNPDWSNYILEFWCSYCHERNAYGVYRLVFWPRFTDNPSALEAAMCSSVDINKDGIADSSNGCLTVQFHASGHPSVFFFSIKEEIFDEHSTPNEIMWD